MAFHEGLRLQAHIGQAGERFRRDISLNEYLCSIGVILGFQTVAVAREIEVLLGAYLPPGVGNDSAQTKTVPVPAAVDGDVRVVVLLEE